MNNTEYPYINAKDEIKTISDVLFLNNVIDKHANFVKHLDKQSDIILGLSTGAFALSVGHMIKEGFLNMPLYMIVILIFSAVSAILALFAIHPPRFMRKKGQKESFLLYNREIIKSGDYKNYAKRIKQLMNNKEDIIEEYALEIFNLVKYYYRPKRTLFVWSRNFFVAGMLISAVLILIELLK